jgi:ABC-type multidrug transport system ATPase subunit
VCDRVGIVDRGRLVAIGTLDELLAESVVRIRVGRLDAETRSALASFGSIAEEGEWLVMRGLTPERVPELVARLVAGGAAVYAVEPMRESLEERFAALVGTEHLG